MHPILFKLGAVEIRSYGLALAISFIVGIYWTIKRSRNRGINENRVLDLAMILIICAVVGSRLMYVLTHTEEFKGRWLDTISPIQSSGEIGLPGLTMLGGVLLCLAALVVFSRVHKISLTRLADVLAPSFAFGLFLTRIGCFLAGCCFGKACDLPWAVRFPLNSPAGAVHLGEHIHPTQLYASLYGLIILIILVLLDRKPRFDGFLMSVFFMLYGVSRFTNDFFRFYESNDQFGLFGTHFTFNQLISFLMFSTGLTMFIVFYRRQKHGKENP